ncbi:3-phosphoserine/phosphohydroxythreonine transaminase [candidate division KSB1 bacterium]|nr:3-phosphoserine/phosphohydroxythreonine transaminase [candidate division KSB1 bacterium]
MAKRIWNFNAGPATLPLAVLEQAKADLPNYNESGMAVMELSHRSKDYDAIHTRAREMFVELFEIPNNFKVLFLQGGASMQFAMVPMNLLKKSKTADYIVTGSWSKKALTEGKIIGNANVAGSSQETNFDRIPKQDELNLTSDAVYCHITSNNTIAGTQFQSFPDTGNVPIVADMSSDILSRKVNFSNVGIIYAGAQKNLGPSGLTVAIVREDLVEAGLDTIPTLLQYRTQADKDSLFNTPPTYAIYLFKLVLDWVKGLGGLDAVEKRNQEKGDLLYGLIDAMPDYYKGAVEKDSRSLMNVTFRLPTEELEAQFIKEGLAAGFGGLKGHRSVGGVRVSMYNALEPQGIKELTEFMKAFAQKNG